MPGRFCTYCLISTLIISVAVGRAAELKVPSQYPTIQSAVNASMNGDVIKLADGRYTGLSNCNIDFGGKAITLQSEKGPKNCIIDCQGVYGRRGFYFHSKESSASVVAGVTITGGLVREISAGGPKGGGIYCSRSSPMFSGCIITNCEAMVLVGADANACGGGVYCSDSNAVLVNCRITNNRVTGGDTIDGTHRNGGNAYGGGVYCKGAGRFIDCNISGNTATGGQGDTIELPNYQPAAGGNAYGGGFYSDANSPVDVNNCLFVRNLAQGGQGGFGIYPDSDGPGGEALAGALYAGKNARIHNCTFSGNDVVGGPGGSTGAATGVIYGDETTIVIDCILGVNTFQESEVSGCTTVWTLTQSGIFGAGNLCGDPHFAAGADGNYYLSRTGAGQEIDSPCVNAGSDSASAVRMSNYTTRTDHIVDVGIVDMGYHYTWGAASPDLDEDCCVRVPDYAILAGNWLDCNWDRRLKGDLNNDYCVDNLDLEILADYWLTAP